MAQCTQKIYFLLKANNEKLSKRSGAENVQRINEKFLRFKQSDLTKNIRQEDTVVGSRGSSTLVPSGDSHEHADVTCF